jgi:CRISPR/Cas system-associated exonuclease Cas4 (RecB family)
MNGGLVVQQYPPHLMSVRVNPQDAAEGAALAVLVERVLGEACQGIEVHSTDGMHALPVGAGARDSVATLLAYMREIDGDAVVAPARADRSCAGCGMRLLCPEGQGGAAGR